MLLCHSANNPKLLHLSPPSFPSCGSRWSNVTISSADDEWFTPLLYWSGMCTNTSSALTSSCLEGNKMNFPPSISASFWGRIGYWSPSLCLLREIIACPNRSPRWQMPTSQYWLILWPAGPNQGWWERGWRWECEVAVDAHDQSGRDPQRPIFSSPHFFGSALPSVFLASVEKEIQRGRLLHSFVWRDLMRSILAERNDGAAKAQA